MCMDSDEISKAVSKMDLKSVENALGGIRKRLDKHFLDVNEPLVYIKMHYILYTANDMLLK